MLGVPLSGAKEGMANVVCYIYQTQNSPPGQWQHPIFDPRPAVLQDLGDVARATTHFDTFTTPFDHHHLFSNPQHTFRPSRAWSTQFVPPTRVFEPPRTHFKSLVPVFDPPTHVFWSLGKFFWSFFKLYLLMFIYRYSYSYDGPNDAQRRPRKQRPKPVHTSSGLPPELQ